MRATKEPIVVCKAVETIGINCVEAKEEIETTVTPQDRQPVWAVMQQRQQMY